MKLWIQAVMIALGLSSTQAFAFPDMIRHGYSQCTACHVSPSGGGLLTAYGRQLSAEILSTWSYQNEGGFLHGAFSPDPSEKGYFLGGDVRAIQVNKETAKAKDGRFFFMQANFDAAITKGKITGFISAGQVTKPTSGHFEGNLNSTSFWAMVQATELISVRVGRFRPKFGLNMPDHELVTRSGIGFYPGLQFDTAETAILGENWTLFGAVTQTVENTTKALKEKAGTLHVGYSFWERFKVGSSAWFGERDEKKRRQIYSLNAQLGLTPKVFVLYDVDYQVSTDQRDLLGFTRLGIEVHKGIIPYLQYQHMRSGTGASPTLTRHYAVGGQFFPRPHFEVAVQWDKIRDASGSSDQAYLLGHYYF